MSSPYRSLKLVRVEPSKLETKRFTAVFNDGTRTHFGDPNASAYIDHKDIQRRTRYWQRHQKDLRTMDPRRAGYLSWYILWQSLSLTKSIRDYNRMLKGSSIKYPTWISGYERMNSKEYRSHMNELKVIPFNK
jgi:hypothetical protein